MRSDALRIRTPEGVLFPLPLAGTMTRFMAWLIDMACVGVLTSTAATVVRLLDLISLDLRQAAMLVSYLAIQIGYGVACEWWWRGQTIGKRLLRLRVIDEQGLKLQFSQILMRNLMRFVDALPAFYLVGGIAAFVSRRAQRLGDFVSNTVVVAMPQVSAPQLERVLSDKFNSLRDQRHLAARLRQRIGPDLANLVLQALLRRDELDPNARVALFRELATALRRLVEFPVESTEGLTDEQYTRNVADIVFRPAGAAG
jgi:uncharacterized RDD family membrane protein YckC